LIEAPIPSIERPDDVLLKVKSAGVCGSDLHGYTGQSGRRKPPLIMGHEATAEVVAVGQDVKDVAIGSRVAIQPLEIGGPYLAQQGKQRRLMGMDAPGAYAEYVVWPAGNLYPLPDQLSYEDGALTEPLSVTLHAVSLAPIRPYDTAFIAGAGPIGLLTLSILRQTGVSRIAVSDVSDSRLEYAQSLGADVVINPTRQKPRETVNEFTGGQGVDISFEAVGISATCQQTLEVTRDRGTVIWIGNNVRMVADFQRSLKMLSDGVIPTKQLINRRATLAEGATLFDELLASPETIKCMINFS
jgi:threonine dehydrogenase-like Zn-dependent dehydrogenase